MVKIDLDDKKCKYTGYYDGDTVEWILYANDKSIESIPTDAYLSQGFRKDVKCYLQRVRWNSPSLSYQIIYNEYKE